MILPNDNCSDAEPDWQNWVLERRNDGVILVRVPSQRRHDAAESLPDAVFSFRDGDPQYCIWSQRVAERELKRA